jgi:hypothetical protein
MLPAFKTLFNEIHIDKEKSVNQRTALLGLRGVGTTSGTGTGQSIRSIQAREQAAAVSRLMAGQRSKRVANDTTASSRGHIQQQ